MTAPDWWPVPLAEPPLMADLFANLHVLMFAAIACAAHALSSR